MATGTVKWFDRNKGYGFIEPDDESEALFVHHTNVSRDEGSPLLCEGERVDYELGHGRKGREAVNVRPREEGRDEGTSPC